jgi:hypothetical protein
MHSSKKADESPDQDDEPNETNEVKSPAESPMLTMPEVAYEPEVVEIPGSGKNKKHPNASL